MEKQAKQVRQIKISPYVYSILTKAVNHTYIINKVAFTFGVPYEDIISESRLIQIATARHVAIYFVHRYFGIKDKGHKHDSNGDFVSSKKTPYELSLTDIGELFGGRNHSTILSSIRKYHDLYDTEPAFRTKVQELALSFGPINS